MEKINDNLEAGARDVRRNLAKRYTYSSAVFDLSGVTDASAAVLREFAVRRCGTNNDVEVCGVEMIIFTATAVTWTATCSNAAWPAMTLLTTASATTESYVKQSFSVDVPSSSADVTFTLSASGTSTITNGYLVVHSRGDRGQQGASHAGYAPTLIDSASSTAGSLIDTQLTALATAVANDTANAIDLRCECFTARSLAAGSSVAFRLPSGVRTLRQVTVYAVSPVGADARVTVTGTGVVGLQVDVVATGATLRAVGTDTPTSSAIPDDPMDSTDDSIVTITTVGVGTADLIYALVWFQ